MASGDILLHSYKSGVVFSALNRVICFGACSRLDLMVYDICMYYNDFNSAMKKRFGTKVYKLSLDGGFTCPNRDGTLDTRGCIFCSGGSGSFSARGSDLERQIESAKERVSSKISGGKFIAYFQSYTNTYAPAERLELLFSRVIARPDIAALAIATRPDCLEPEKLRLLSRLNQIKPVWVELGLQTVNEDVARYIRRGYSLSVYDDAMLRLRGAGLETVVHMIIGLPGETAGDIFRTASYISQSGADGIKLQLLHVLRGTDLFRDYERGLFKTLEMDEYISLLQGCIRRLRPDIVIHRLTGDGDKRELAAPLWSGNKKAVLNAIRRAFAENDLVQGSLL